jgi:large subunit ribosomal protein L11
MPETIEALVDAGKASGGPPLGPALGPLGVNIGAIVDEINKRTKNFEGMKVPVKVIVDEKTKDFEITIGTPPTSALILKELGIEKGGQSTAESPGDITLDQVIKVAQSKGDTLSGENLKSQVQEVVGTCVSMVITVEGIPAKEFAKLIKAGKYDGKLT